MGNRELRRYYGTLGEYAPRIWHRFKRLLFFAAMDKDINQELPSPASTLYKETHAKLNVLHVSRWACAGTGGIQTYLANLAAGLAGLAVSSRYASIMPSTAPPYAEQPPHQGKWGAPEWVNVLRLWLWLRRNLESVDVVHIHHAVSWQALVGALACRSRHVPYVISPHGALYPWSLSRRAVRSTIFLKLIGVRLLRRSAAVLATTDTEAAVIRRIDPGLSIKVLRPGIPLPIGPDSSTDQDRSIGAKPELNIAFLGRLEPVKGLPILIQAIALMRGASVNARLDIMGSGETGFVADLQAMIRRLNIADSVTFHGPLSGKAKEEVLRRADAMALPSKMESFSFATAEALAMGLPVVISSEVALADTVKRYNCGVVVPVGDAPALASALRGFQDPQTKADYARRAVECARKEFSLSSMGQAHAAVYRDVAIRKGRRT